MDLAFFAEVLEDRERWLSLTADPGAPSAVLWPAYGAQPIPLGHGEGVHAHSGCIFKIGVTIEQLLESHAAIASNRDILTQLKNSPVGHSSLLDEQLRKGPAQSLQQLYSVAPGLMQLGPNVRLTLYKAEAGIADNPAGWWGYMQVHEWGVHFGAPFGFCSSDNQDEARCKFVAHEHGQNEFKGFADVYVADVNVCQMIINADTNDSSVCCWLPDFVGTHSPGDFGKDAEQQMGRTIVIFKSRRGGPDIRVGVCFAPLLLPLLSYGMLQLSPACLHTAFGNRMMLTRFGSWIYFGGAASVLAHMRAVGIPAAPFTASIVCTVDERMGYLAGSPHSASMHAAESALSVQCVIEAVRNGVLSGGALMVGLWESMGPVQRMAVEESLAAAGVQKRAARTHDEE